MNLRLLAKHLGTVSLLIGATMVFSLPLAALAIVTGLACLAVVVLGLWGMLKAEPIPVKPLSSNA